MISDRGLDVLRAIVRDYVASSEPVGSKSIVERHHFGVSAATIRNDMAMLEEAELIVAPHTSSGRVPTDKGYRLFVDRLDDMRPLSSAQRQAIERFLDEAADLDDVMVRTVRLLSQLTNQVALAQYPSVSRATVRRVETVGVSDTRLLLIVIFDSGRIEQRIVDAGQQINDLPIAALGQRISQAISNISVTEVEAPLLEVLDTVDPELDTATHRTIAVLGDVLAPEASDRLVIAGSAHLVRTGGDFHRSVMPVLEAIEEQVTLLRLIGEMDAADDGVATRIGRENTSGLDETSIVAGTYGAAGHEAGRIGVLGPTRMDYASNMAAVRAVARYLTRLLDEEQ